jgi:hypothetical protein
MKKMFLLLGVTVFMLSCGKKNSQPSASASNVDSNPKFDESVALFQQTNTNVQSREKSTKVAYTFEMIDFSGDLTLGNVYKLEGIEYCDNGLFNDEIAGDGIYTSVETFSNSPIILSNFSDRDKGLVVGSGSPKYLRLSVFKYGTMVSKYEGLSFRSLT